MSSEEKDTEKLNKEVNEKNKEILEIEEKVNSSKPKNEEQKKEDKTDEEKISNIEEKKSDEKKDKEKLDTKKTIQPLVFCSFHLCPQRAERHTATVAFRGVAEESETLKVPSQAKHRWHRTES